MATILIVEDERNLAEGLKFNLEMEGYTTAVVPSAEEAATRFQDFDLLILDLMLPGADGISFLRELRARDLKLPVLILSAKAAEEDLVAGLQAGADDYVTKPFSLPELLLRIKRMLERRAWYAEHARSEAPYAFGSYTIHFESLSATTNRGEVRLTAYECEVMRYLIENRERAVTREELLKNVWGYAVTPETRTVDTFIARLRKLFEEDPQKPRHIQSIRDVGYRFVP